jgi:hypothetical protein
MPSKMLKIGRATQIELLRGARREFVGLGRVTIGGVPLRNPDRPIQFRLDTPDGVLYPHLELTGVERLPGGAAIVRLAAHGVHWGRGEYADDYDLAIYHLRDDAAPLVDELELHLAPAKQVLGGRTWLGFTYRLRFRSQTRQLHRLLTHATWEIGGRITGNTVLAQGQCNMPVYHGSVAGLFTTACLRTLDQYGQMQGNSFQLGPRAGLIQGFDFQGAAAGVLWQYWTEFAAVNSLLESPPGSDLLHVVDEYHVPLATEAWTPAKHVLFSAGEAAEHELRDLWWDAREFVYGGLCRKYAITPTPTRPEGFMKYSTRVADGRLRMNVMGEEVDSQEVPYAVGDKLLPKLAAQGVKRFFPEVMNESDVTQVGMKRKLDNGVHGDLHCASVCATHRFFPSEFWGGIKAWRYMYDQAQRLGMELGSWFAPHFSPRAPIYAEHPEYRFISVTGLPAGGGYGFQTLVVADWNTPIRHWVLNDLRRWKEEGGLDYLFVDSLSNLGLLQVNYQAAMRTNHDALARLFAEIQGLGIRNLSCECISPFLAGRFGVTDLRGDLLGQNKAVAGQNDFAWWLGEEDMATNICMSVAARKRTPEELERALFRAMANRGYTSYECCYDLLHNLPDWQVRLNHLYNQALPAMAGRRRLLPGRTGTCWLNAAGRPTAIWTFAEATVAIPAGATVRRLEAEGRIAVGYGPAVTLPAWGIYLVE